MYPISDRSTRRISPDLRGTPVNGLPPTNTVPPQSPTNRGSTLNGVLETRLVIGLDFGTTYTGVAYATPSGTVCPLDKITFITDWGLGMKNHDKVPSIISYTQERGYQQWGSNIGPNSFTMVHKKLELSTQSLQGELDLVVQVLEGMKDLHFEKLLFENEDNEIPAYACKSPEQIVTDYLTKIFKYLDFTVREFGEAYRKHTTTDLVVTVPTDWPYEALNSTYRAVTRAGFNRQNFPKLNDVMFMTESEAAARFTVRFYKELQFADFLHDNSYFVLCDAGGGTVDVVSYKVARTHPVLQLQQIGRPTGAKCGSIFINQKFKMWLRTKVGDYYYRQLDPNFNMDKAAAHASESPVMRQLMEEFDKRKEQFTAEEPREIGIDLPYPLDNITIPGAVYEGLLTISRRQMESFFDECLEEIVKLLEDHMDQIEAVARGRAKNLFLVGGFGSSKYLKHHLEDTMALHNIHFRSPDKKRRDMTWTAIVQGAVVCGIENAQIPSIRRGKACPCSYGVSLDEAFQETSHAQASMVQKGNGQWYAQSQFIWLLNEGDVIVFNVPRIVKREFDIDFSKNQSEVGLPIYRWSTAHGGKESDRPDRLGNAMDEVTKAAVLTIDLSKLRHYFQTKSGSARGFRESLYQGVKTKQPDHHHHPQLKLLEGVFFSALKSQYRVTLKLVFEVSWESLQASISWEHYELARVTVPFVSK